MGYLHYGETRSFAFTDRDLNHLRTVILSKLNLQESFVFTWIDGESQRSIWLHPAIPLQFEFDEEPTPGLNPARVRQLLAMANSAGGLRLRTEPESDDELNLAAMTDRSDAVSKSQPHSDQG